MPESNPTFLRTPTLNQLLNAVAENHLYRMVCNAESRGGSVHREEGITWVYTPGEDGAVEIAFPRSTPERVAQILDRIVAFARRRRPMKQIACWSLAPPQPRNLGAYLVARGFQWGWRPRWMWLNMNIMQVEHPIPKGLQIEIVDDQELWDVDDIPYYDRASAAYWQVTNQTDPRRIWHFAALLNGDLVGHSMVLITTGRLGIAGIYDVGVRPEARGQGIGKAITIAACQHARKIGCDHAMLNGTGERMYRQIGFEHIGDGHTWWMLQTALDARSPSKKHRGFAEAIGTGDVKTLETEYKGIPSKTLRQPMFSGMTPMQFAINMGQSASVRWLVNQLNS